MKKWLGAAVVLCAVVGAAAYVATRQEPPEAPVEAKPKPKRHKSRVRATGIQAGSGDDNSLTMPSPKPCLAAPTEVGAGDAPEMAASAGLADADVRAALATFSPHLVSCFADAPGGTVLLSVTVGCDGRVSAVKTEEDGGFSQEILSCVHDRLGYAAFPAHDMPDGFSFSWPLRYSQD